MVCRETTEEDDLLVQVPVGISLDDLIRLGEEIVPGGANASADGSPADMLGDKPSPKLDSLSPLKLALYLSHKVPIFYSFRRIP